MSQNPNNDLPNPSADEEVERQKIKARIRKLAEELRWDETAANTPCFILLEKGMTTLANELSQQHNAEREDWQAFDKIHRSQIEFHQSELRQLRTSLAESKHVLDTIAAIVSPATEFKDGSDYIRAVEQYAADTLQTERQLQTAMEERDATAKEAIKKLIDVKVLLSGEPKLPIHAIDIINDLMTRLSTSRETENKT